MRNIRDKNGYAGSLVYPDETLSFRMAEPGDVPALAALYRDIAITGENYRVKLDPASEDSFAHTGGMFLIHSAESLLEELTHPASSVGVMCAPEGSLACSFWFAEDDPGFHGYKPSREDFPGGVDACDALLRAWEAGKVVFPRELIVNPATPRRRIANASFYTMFRSMRYLGYTHAMCEVYKVTALEDASGRRPLSLLNSRSFRMVQRTGAWHLGGSQARRIDMGAFTVTIEPQVFAFQFDVVLPVMEAEFAAADMKFCFEEGGV